MHNILSSIKPEFPLSSLWLLLGTRHAEDERGLRSCSVMLGQFLESCFEALHQFAFFQIFEFSHLRIHRRSYAQIQRCLQREEERCRQGRKSATHARNVTVEKSDVIRQVTEAVELVRTVEGCVFSFPEIRVVAQKLGRMARKAPSQPTQVLEQQQQRPWPP